MEVTSMYELLHFAKFHLGRKDKWKTVIILTNNIKNIKFRVK